MLLRLRFKLIGLMIVSGTRPTSKRSKSSVIGRFGGRGCTIWGTSFQSFPPSSKIHNVGHELAFVVGLFDFMYLKFCGNCDLFNQSKRICFSRDWCRVKVHPNQTLIQTESSCPNQDSDSLVRTRTLLKFQDHLGPHQPWGRLGSKDPNGTCRRAKFQVYFIILTLYP